MRISRESTITVLAVIAVAATALAQATGIPARTSDYNGAMVENVDYPVLDRNGDPAGKATWRVVANTGNCCENYLAVTKQGRLLDFGGTYLRFSDDKGQTWKEVRPIEPLVSGEGAITVAPNNDLIGMTWDPYSGDHILTFKYEAGANSWIYSETKLHAPFFDRPWIAVVKGPFRIGSQKIEYISILTSNFWRDPWYISLDGLNYFLPTHRSLDGAFEGLDDGKLKLDPDPAADWMQPQTQSGIIPMSGGGALSSDMNPFEDGVPAFVLKGPNLRWKRFEDKRLPRGRLLVDSRGWLHNVRAKKGDVIYSISATGGKTWTKKTVDLPGDHRSEDFDFRANGALGITAIAVHAHSKSEEQDQDLVYRFSTKKRKPVLTHAYFVGNGDLDIGFGLGSNIRFDFPTLAILPDGTIATSFGDDAHREPATAILLDSPR